jgi:hypothetical protein
MEEKEEKKLPYRSYRYIVKIVDRIEKTRGWARESKRLQGAWG